MYLAWLDLITMMAKRLRLLQCKFLSDVNELRIFSSFNTMHANVKTLTQTDVSLLLGNVLIVVMKECKEAVVGMICICVEAKLYKSRAAIAMKES